MGLQKDTYTVRGLIQKPFWLMMKRIMTRQTRIPAWFFALFLWAGYAVYGVSSGRPSTHRLIELVRIQPGEELKETLQPIKTFIATHPESLARGTQELVYRAVYAGSGNQLLATYTDLGKDRMLEKALAYTAFQQMGYPPPDSALEELCNWILTEAESWEQLTMPREFLLVYVKENGMDIPDRIAQLPMTQETRTYRAISDKVAALEFNGTAELVRSFPHDSDYLWMVVDEFPNTNGEMNRQLPIMEELATSAREAGNLLDALRMEAQIIALQVNYSAESHLDRDRYDRVLAESESLGNYYNTIDLVSTLALRHMFSSNYEESLRYSLEAVRLSDKYHLPLSKGIYAGYAGICYSNLAQYDKALEANQKACDALKDLDPGWYWIWREKLAYLYMVLGDTDTSEDIYLEVMNQHLEDEYPLQAQYTYRNLTELYLMTGELEKAASYMARVDTDAFPGMARKNMAIAGRLAYARGNYPKAQKLLEASVNDPAPMDVSTLLDTQITLAATYQAMGQLTPADQAYRTAETLFEEIAQTRFTNLAYRSGFFQEYQQLYINHITFLVNQLKQPDKAWMLVRRLRSGPFQYFAEACVDHFREIVSVPESTEPPYSISQMKINNGLRKLMVRVSTAVTSGKTTFLAGPGGVFRTDGLLFTRVAEAPDIFALSANGRNWAGISEKRLYLNGTSFSLPEKPDRILTGVHLTEHACFVSSSSGLYRISEDQASSVLEGNIICMLPRNDVILVAVSGKGLYNWEPTVEPGQGMTEVRMGLPGRDLEQVISLTPWKQSGLAVFTPDSVFLKDQEKDARQLVFPYGTIDGAWRIAPDRWVIQTALQDWFLLEDQRFRPIDAGPSPLRSVSTASGFRFWSTGTAIHVEREPATVKLSLPAESAGQPPSQAVRLDEETVALVFTGRGVSVHRIHDGSSVGFFAAPVQQFSASSSTFCILETNEQLAIYNGSPLEDPYEMKRIYIGSPIAALYQDMNSAVIASPIAGGLVRWTPTDPPHFFGQRNGLPAGSAFTCLLRLDQTLYLGTDNQVVSFVDDRAGITYTLEGKIRTFSSRNDELLAGTTRGVFSIRNGTITQYMTSSHSGTIHHLSANGILFAAAAENGVYLNMNSITCLVTIPEQIRFAFLGNENILMVSDNNLVILQDPVCPVLVRQGTNRFAVLDGTTTLNLQRNDESNVYLCSADGIMTAVSHQDTERFELSSAQLGDVVAAQLPPFGVQPPFTTTPVLTSDNRLVNPSELKPGRRDLTVVGGRPFRQQGWHLNASVVRSISRVWWVVGFLILLIGWLLVSRYIKWKRARYIAHYKLLEKLGEGGMGTVFKARDIRHSRTVALKILNRQMDESVIERFKREWQMLDKLGHPNIIRVFDRGEHMEQFFIAMEYLNGHTLDEILEHNGPLPEEAVVSIAISVANALEAIHEQNIIHRDLKPSNIMVIRHSEKLTGRIRPDQIKLMDFGVSKELLEEGLTSTGNLVGTLLYLAPESLSSLRVDSRSDLYALGVLMYELLSGMPPFYDENQVSIYYKIINSPPPPFSEDVTVSQQMKSIIWRCLSKDPAERYQSPADIREALQRILQN